MGLLNILVGQTHMVKFFVCLWLWLVAPICIGAIRNVTEPV